MSHNKERAEKVCLNCGAALHGRYCHQCGQENLEPKESFWHLVTHYANDITHFDGKFFSTLKYLILRPGFLPAEYLKGKRASYLHPIRMYVFTSAFFFIIFFSIFRRENFEMNDSSRLLPDSTRISRIQVKEQGLKNAKTKEDSAEIQNVLNKLKLRNAVHIIDSTSKENVEFNVVDPKYATIKQYDSVQKALPAGERDGWIERRLTYQSIAIRQKYHDDKNAIKEAWIEKFMHSFPQLLFLSLPLFAFTLWLLYIRRNRQYFYTGHVVFTLYLYIYYFIAYLFFFGLMKLHKTTGWGIWGWVEFAWWLYMMYYLYKAMRNFYQQRRFKTIVKVLLLSIASVIIVSLLFLAFTILSVFQI